ncbi:MAG: NUDIX hydrolase [Bacteroidales bacterium]|jgi:8-oxo-dGTP diphosphatase
MAYSYQFPHPALTVDAVLFTFSGNDLNALFIQRGKEPFKDKWAFPGGFVDENETVEQAVKRELQEEVSLAVDNLEPFHIASAPGRDPRGWTVSVVFAGFIGWDNRSAEAGDDAANAKWLPLHSVPYLAFDHRDILNRAKKYLQKLVRHSVIRKAVLPAVFLIEQLHAIYFEITGSTEESDKLIQRLIDSSVVVRHTYKDLYKFDPVNYEKLLATGYHEF